MKPLGILLLSLAVAIGICWLAEVFRPAPIAYYDAKTDSWSCPAGWTAYADENQALAGHSDYVHCVR